MRHQLRLHVGAAAEGGHWQVKERRQRTQNRFQRHKLTERHQMVLVVTVGRVVAVRVIFTEGNDGVVGIVAVLLIETRIDNAGDQRTVFGAQQIVHHAEELLLVDLQIRDRRLGPDNQLRVADMRLGQRQVGFQGVDQLLLVPLHGLWDIALHQRDLGRALRQQLIPLDIAQRERQGEQQRGNSQRLPVTLDEGQGQQAANHHQQEVDRLDAHHRRETFQRAVDLAIAELQPWEAGQHPAAQELGDLPDDGGGDSHPQPAGFGPQPGEQAGKQAGIEREIGRQQNDEKDVNRTWHTAELRDADIDPVDTGAKQPESPEIADPGALQRASVEG